MAHDACTLSLPGSCCPATHPSSEMQQPLTRTASVAAPESVSQIPREASRLGLELRPEMLRSRAAPPHLVIDDSLIPCLTTREPHSLRNASDTTIALCAEFAVARHPEPDFTVDTWYFRTALETARGLVVPRARPRARSRWGVRSCTDSGWSQSTLKRHYRMTIRRRKWETGFLVG